MSDTAAIETVATGVAPWFWPGIVLLALVAGYSVYRMAAIQGRSWVGMATAALFGAWVVLFWEILVRALDVPRVLLPAPSLVIGSIGDHQGSQHRGDLRPPANGRRNGNDQCGAGDCPWP